MSTIAASRRSSSSATAKRPAMDAGGPRWTKTQATKRVALGNITNVSAPALGRRRAAFGKVAPPATTSAKLNPATSAAPLKKPYSANARNVSSIRGSAVKSASIKPAPCVSRLDGSTTQKHNAPPPKVPTTIDVPSRAPALVPWSSFVSPGHSGDSVSIDETMSICDSMKSPDFEYIDNGDSSMLASLQQRANEHLRISEDTDVKENKWKKNAPAPIEINRICDVDNAYEDPQLCATWASDIYINLREAETKKRPSTDFMETIHKSVNASMRAILIDWLVLLKNIVLFLILCT